MECSEEFNEGAALGSKDIDEMQKQTTQRNMNINKVNNENARM